MVLALTRRTLKSLALAISLAVLAPGSGAQASGPDWTTLMGGVSRIGYNSAETAISASTAGGLKRVWTAHATAAGSPAAASVYSQPIMSSSLGLVFWGSFNGREYATNLSTGATVWSTNLGQTIDTACQPVTLGVVSTATLISSYTVGAYTGPVIFVGGGNAKVYALAATTVGTVKGGTILWSHSVGPSPQTFVWSSPAYYRGSLYIGVASNCDTPLVQGKLLQLSAATGSLSHEFDVVPAGCVGGGIWSSPAIDTRGIGNGGTPTVYFSTGNPGACTTTEKYTEAIVEVSVTNVSTLLGYWSVPAAEQATDGDFGTTTTIHDFSSGGTSYHRVGLLNKNGTYYEFTRGALAAGPRWRAKVAKSSGAAAQPSSAFDGTNLYVASGGATIGTMTCAGTINGVNPLTGAFNWRHCFNSGAVYGQVMAAPGVAVVEEGHYLVAVATATGRTLFSYYDSSSAMTGTPTISNGMLFAGDNGGSLFAFH